MFKAKTVNGALGHRTTWPDDQTTVKIFNLTKEVIFRAEGCVACTKVVFTYDIRVFDYPFETSILNIVEHRTAPSQN